MTTRKLRIRLMEHLRNINNATKDLENGKAITSVASHCLKRYHSRKEELECWGVEKVSLGIRGGDLEMALLKTESKWIYLLNTVQHQNAVFRQELLSQGPPTMNNSSITTLPSNITEYFDPFGGHTVLEVVLILLTTGVLSLVTVVGNVLVLLAFKVNSDLKTVNNYFLLSLACADIIIGAVSMNLYTTYIVMGRWALGNISCDLWLALDYVASNASVMNLLIISFDRYFSITRPLTYRAKRTHKRAAIMIGMAWLVSFVLWAPAILFWQYIEGKRTVEPHECSIQFLSQPIITFGTAIAAFYLPVTIMIILYWRIYRETENRSRELAGLQGSESENIVRPAALGSVRSGSSSGIGESKRLSRSQPTVFKVKQACCFPRRLAANPSLKSYPENRSNGSWNTAEDAASADSLSSSSDVDDRPYEMKSICSAVIRLPMVSSVVGTPTGSRGSNDTLGRGEVEVDQNGGKRDMTRKASKPLVPALPSTVIKAKVEKNRRVKRKSNSLIKEKKAAQTLSAILLAFILTWTPYNIMVLVSTVCKDCIPEALWKLGYWLCYVNSTINPMCYALCNRSFRRTFKMLLLCRWDRRKWRAHRQPPAFFRTPSQ
ncbi:muscarinic acetylcholine receptor M1 [Bombina bombina]|uniref:muscarinic acetylcholine receptor M1 n=1 Tax=Bombina bombina TaxID=8345 RepID=UPI00235AC3AD|nr:muscarinic acetylcholine receptor M1 [Bombina bombina]